MNSSIRCLNLLGQSVWLDNLTRGLIRSGKLKSLIEQGVSGITTNPTIFYKAVHKSEEYDNDIRMFALSQRSYFRNYSSHDYIPSMYDSLAVTDIVEAADLLRPVYDNTKGNDGFVSIEVDPSFAYRIPHTLAHASWLWDTINRPNVMIKIPATPPGIEAIRTLIAMGINVNATLIFSLEQYEQVSQAYISGLKDRLTRHLPIHHIRSVASLFVSRIDTVVDGILDRLDLSSKKYKDQEVRGFAGIANSQIAYDMYKIVFGDKSFEELQNHGAAPQKLLWASTSVKDERYEALKYVKALVGENTVITLPWDTLDALMKSSAKFLDSVDAEVHLAYDFIDEWLHSVLENDGLLLNDLEGELLHEGVEMFVISYDEVVSLLDARLRYFLENSGDASLYSQP